MTRDEHQRDTERVSQWRAAGVAGTTSESLGDYGAGIDEATEQRDLSITGDAIPPTKVRRGLTDNLSARHLRSAIWRHALTLADRFRVIRTIDIAVRCFPERDYKAALTAAQRAMRGLVKADLLKRYRTDRFQTVYGLTQRGADWLRDLDHEAAASVRRVSDMTNPEHRLWSQFLVLAAEARGLRAWTEAELMQHLASTCPGDTDASRGLLMLMATTPSGSSTKALRPDALVAESDGATWLEVDRSARGSDRAADLRGLALSVGSKLADGQVLRRVVVFTRTERIGRRVQAALRQAAEHAADAALVKGRRQLKQTPSGEFEVWLTEDRVHRDRRVSLVDRLAGHVVVQALPVWLPKLRLDGRGGSSTAGWMGENYLPYRRPGLTAWPTLTSPLLGTHSSTAQIAPVESVATRS